jgi:hypothetical protein
MPASRKWNQISRNASRVPNKESIEAMDGAGHADVGGNSSQTARPNNVNFKSLNMIAIWTINLLME